MFVPTIYILINMMRNLYIYKPRFVTLHFILEGGIFVPTVYILKRIRNGQKDGAMARFIRFLVV